MTEIPPEIQHQPETTDENAIPWTTKDTWVGLLIMVFTFGSLALLGHFYRETTIFQTIGLLGSEFALLVPVVIILGLRKADWHWVGLRKFKASFVGLGCGLLITSYVIVIANNLILIALHIPTQGDAIYQLLLKLKYPYWLFFVAVIVAPLVEEIFFRGFLFAGFRQSYGWQKAAVISSLVFSISHLNFAAVIPTFVLGFAFSYLYQKARSIWPGIVMHFLVNAMGTCALALMQQYRI